MLVATRKNVVTVPVAAVQHDSTNNTFVYLLDTTAKTVKMQPVTVGAEDFAQTEQEITKGVTAGETVVTDGTDKLQDGSKVIISKPVENTTADSDAGAGTTTPAVGGTTPAPDPGKSGAHHHKKKSQSDDSPVPAS